MENRKSDQVLDHIEIISSTEWLREGITTLDKIKADRRSEGAKVGLKAWVFGNYIIPAFRAILSAGKITTAEAELVNEVVQNHLSDALLDALSQEQVRTIELLLMPFSEHPSSEVVEQVKATAEQSLKEALAMLDLVKTAERTPGVAGQLTQFAYAHSLHDAVKAIAAKGSMTGDEAALINAVLAQHVETSVAQNMSAEWKSDIQKLLAPFAIDAGVDADLICRVA